jgi:hypothetical protein
MDNKTNLNYMKYLLLLSIIYSEFTHGQTCIVAKKTKDTIFVGSDSRISRTRYDGTVDTGSICKIYTFGKLNIALIGSFFDEAIAITKKAGKIEKSFAGLRRTYEDSMKKLIINFYIKNVPSQSWTSFEKKNPLPSIIFFGTQGDSLYLSLSGFIMQNNKIVFASRDGDILADGQIDEIWPTLFNKSTWVQGEVATIKKMITIEAKAHPDHVGGAINIVKYTKKSTTWMPKKNQCN